MEALRILFQFVTSFLFEPDLPADVVIWQSIAQRQLSHEKCTQPFQTQHRILCHNKETDESQVMASNHCNAKIHVQFLFLAHNCVSLPRA